MTVPRFSIIKQHIESQIEDGVWPPGTRVPSENELGQSFGVSRMTARRALDKLAEEGLLVRSQGLGSFVADVRPMSSMMQIRNIADEIASRGHEYHCKVHVVEAVKASRALGLTFQKRRGATLYHSILIHHENGVAVQHEERWVNPSFGPAYLEQDYEKVTPSAYLQQSAPLTEADHLIEAVCVERDIARRLGIKVTDPCLKLTRKSWCKQGIVSLAWLLHPGDRYRLGDHLQF